MKFDYITNFKPNEKQKEYINLYLKKKKFYINKNNIIISKEYLNNEKNSKSYDKICKRKIYINKERIYYKPMLKLCNKYCETFGDVLELGAGYGYFTERFINKFNFNSYTIYEFSFFLFNVLQNKLESKKNKKNIKIYKENFKNISTKLLEQYNCVIALEVFEHIRWDKKFLSKLKKDTWVFFTVPVFHAYNHVRAFLVPDSIAYRYKNILKIYEIFGQIKYEDDKLKSKLKHYYYSHWLVAGKRK